MHKRLTFIVLLILLNACTGAQIASVAPSKPPLSSTLPESGSLQMTNVPEKTASPTVPVITPTPTIQQNDNPICSCSPVEGISIKELPDIVSNPFEMPDPGKDDGHQGVDFSFYRHGDQVGMIGLAVNSMLPGTVAAVIRDRPPYGNAVIVETALEDLPAALLTLLDLPEVSPTVEPFSALYCPETTSLPTWNSSQRSIYMLYAHMEKDPQLNIGDPVSCCQQLGHVGTSGNSVNEHLHLEFRIGPSEARFNTMAHYDNSCTDEEMVNYCTWRVSNTFQLVDPMQFVYILQSK